VAQGLLFPEPAGVACPLHRVQRVLQAGAGPQPLAPGKWLPFSVFVKEVKSVFRIRISLKADLDPDPGFNLNVDPDPLPDSGFWIFDPQANL